MHLSEGRSALEVSREVCMSHLQSIDVSTLVATQMGGGSASRKPLWAVFCIWFNTEGGIEDVKEVFERI